MAARTKKPPMTNKKFMAVWIPILAVLLVLVVVANIAIGIFDKWIGSQLGAGTYTVENSEAAQGWDTDYYDADFESIDDLNAAAADLIEQIEGEGIVLAKNAEGSLPLDSGAKVTMLGRSAADPIYGGSGSGSVDTTSAIDAKTGLTDAGFQINEAVYSTIEAYAAENDRAIIEMDSPETSRHSVRSRCARRPDRC